jgi:hypothetical protein
MLSKDDQEWLLLNHAELEVSNELIKGTLRIHNYIVAGVPISDSYKIEVRHHNFSDKPFPIVNETGDKIIKTPDHHINSNGTCCLAGSFSQLDYFRNPRIDYFFNYYLVPYFASQTYYSRFGNWPQGELTHGVLGIIEDMFDCWEVVKDMNLEQITLLLNNSASAEEKVIIRNILNGNETRCKCPCNSSHLFSKCHQKAFTALRRLRKLLNRFNEKRFI